MRPLKLFTDICWAAHRPIAMHSKQRDMSCRDAGRSRLLLCRTIPLVICLLVTMAQGTVPEQQETLVEMISVELEASMQSSVLSELQAAASSVGEGPPTALPDCSAKNGGVHNGIPDSSAIVGQVFQLRVPPGFANTTCNIHKIGQPILDRYMEAVERPKAFEELGRQIQLFMKVIEAFKAKDEQYNHLDELEVTRVEKQVNDAMVWMNSKMNQQNSQDLTLEPVVRVQEIQAKTKELHSACNPVVSKPKPKVEPPKEEKIENGPVNGQEGTENQPPNPDKATSAGTEQETAENKLPEMDID